MREQGRRAFYRSSRLEQRHGDGGCARDDRYGRGTKGEGCTEDARCAKSGRRAALCVLAGTLALVLAVLAGVLCSVSVAPRRAYAVSDCGILFVCPSPTPGPSPTPTPKPSPTPQPTPTPRPTPTATPTALPTATPVPTQTPAPAVHPTHISNPASPSQNTNSLPDQQGNNGTFPPYLPVIIAVTFFLLLFALGAGLLLFRRMLLPQITVKLPPSGARPWSRFRVPNPWSLVGNNDSQIVWEVPPAAVPVAAANAQTSADHSAFQASGNPGDPHDPLAFHVGAGDTSWEMSPIQSDPKPGSFDSSAFLESVLSSQSLQAVQPGDERETGQQDMI